VGFAERSAQGRACRQRGRKAAQRLRAPVLSGYRGGRPGSPMAGTGRDRPRHHGTGFHRCPICGLSRSAEGGYRERASRRAARYSRRTGLSGHSRPFHGIAAEARSAAPADHRPGTGDGWHDTGCHHAASRGDPARPAARGRLMPELSAIQRYEPYFARSLAEVAADLESYAKLLVKWQSVQNLVSRETLGQVWTRHFADSLQILSRTGPTDRLFLDFGSGGGFPALPMAIGS